MPLAAPVDQTLLAKTVGSGIFQFSYYLIAISANAGCMDLGFIVRGQRTLVKQGNHSTLVNLKLQRRPQKHHGHDMHDMHDTSHVFVFLLFTNHISVIRVTKYLFGGLIEI